jgi:hypothetical protein
MGFFDIEPQKLKPSEIIDFVIKDKFSYVYNGYTRFIFVDENNVYYEIPVWGNINENIYTWKRSQFGDRIRRVIEYDRSEVSKCTFILLNDIKLKVGENV